MGRGTGRIVTDKTSKTYSRCEARRIFKRYYGRRVKKGYHLHHKDGNAFNNDIQNLIECTPEEHLEFHRQMGDVVSKTGWIHTANNKGTLGKRWSKRSTTEEEKIAKSQIQSPISGEFEVIKNGIIKGRWETVYECARDLELQRCNIRRCLLGKRKTHKGYEFKFVA